MFQDILSTSVHLLIFSCPIYVLMSLTYVPVCTEPTYQRDLWAQIHVAQCQSKSDLSPWEMNHVWSLKQPSLPMFAFLSPTFFVCKNSATVISFYSVGFSGMPPIGHLPAVLWHVAFRASLMTRVFHCSYFWPSTGQPTILLNPGPQVLMILRHQLSLVQLSGFLQNDVSQTP